jgi:hypothetical protein
MPEGIHVGRCALDYDGHLAPVLADADDTDMPVAAYSRVQGIVPHAAKRCRLRAGVRDVKLRPARKAVNRPQADGRQPVFFRRH